jgi:PBP1b-binding outer membrane lipoprotein LpoB
MQQLNVLIKKSIVIVLCFIALSFTGCAKGSESPTPTPPTPQPPVVVAEADVLFRVDIAGSEVNYAAIYPVVGTTLLMNTNITSTMPKDGVTIDVVVRKKLDNTIVFNTSISSLAASNTVTITGLTSGVLCIATITVTSKSKASNTALKSFELASK